MRPIETSKLNPPIAKSCEDSLDPDSWSKSKEESTRLVFDQLDSNDTLYVCLDTPGSGLNSVVSRAPGASWQGMLEDP